MSKRTIIAWRMNERRWWPWRFGTTDSIWTTERHPAISVMSRSPWGPFSEDSGLFEDMDASMEAALKNLCHDESELLVARKDG